MGTTPVRVAVSKCMARAISWEYLLGPIPDLQTRRTAPPGGLILIFEMSVRNIQSCLEPRSLSWVRPGAGAGAATAGSGGAKESLFAL